jgi:hypothetical protein
MSARETLVRNISDTTLLAGLYRTREAERPDTSGGPPESSVGRTAWEGGWTSHIWLATSVSR